LRFSRKLAYAAPPDLQVVITAVYALVNAHNVGAWAVFGVALRRWLTNPRMTRLFNVGMAALLVASLYPLFSEAVR